MHGRITTQDGRGIGGALTTDGDTVTHTRSDGSFDGFPTGSEVTVILPPSHRPLDCIIEAYGGRSITIQSSTVQDDDVVLVDLAAVADV